MNNFIKIFCLHHTDVPERKETLTSFFDKYNIRVEWVESFHPSTEKVKEAKLNSPLTVSEISICMKQFWVLNKIVNKNIPYALLLEDDVHLEGIDDFRYFINRCLSEMKDLKGDLTFVGECCGFKPRNVTPDKYVYYQPDYESRCAHAIIIKRRSAELCIKYTNDNDLPMDHKYNQMIQFEKLRTCHTEPSILQNSIGQGNLNSYEGTIIRSGDWVDGKMTKKHT